MLALRKIFVCAALATAVAVGAVPLAAVTAAPVAASEIKYIVNGTPVTSYDIQRRAAFLRLQRKKADTKHAADEMIEQALKMSEAKRIGVRIGDRQVDDAYNRFAQSNRMQVKQLDGVMAQSGVTKAHFKDYIRAQMSWGQVLSARARSIPGRGGLTEQQAARRMLEQGGQKPTATEYMLQQVIFVVPQSARGSLGKRKQEAEAMRSRFRDCSTTREFAKGLLDVTVKDLGRVLAPQLPPEWADQIKKTQAGHATAVRQTDRGVEFIGVCSSREVSDDRVAQLVFNSEAQGSDAQTDEASAKLLDEIRKRATIVQR